jgi:hypothetical protein
MNDPTANLLHRSRARRPCTTVLPLVRAWLAARALSVAVAAIALPITLLGCGGKEFDGVRNYKVFLEKARPALTAMNKAREELYQLENPDLMLPRFKDDLLPQIEALKNLADAQDAGETKPEGKLADVHRDLRSTLDRYHESTKKLADKLKSRDEEVRESAVLVWGEQDQAFGREMTRLVDELTKYLDGLSKK